MKSLTDDMNTLLQQYSPLKEWVEWQPNAGLHDETYELLTQITSGKISNAAVADLFEKRLEFGTAGIRGKMAIGFNRFNTVTVLQTSQGVCEYLLKTFGSDMCASRGVIIGFDGRLNSKKFAHCSAAVFKSKNFKVYLTSKMVPTPFVAFAVLKYKCVLGIMITASHNPKDDNGYKVYGELGAQIVPPVDREIMAYINNNLSPWQKVFALLEDTHSGYLQSFDGFIDPYLDLFQNYTESMASALCTNKLDVEASKVKMVYTALHGVGYPAVEQLLKLFGCSGNLYPLSTQRDPDPNFSTVTFPNPEESEALALAIEYADEIGAPIVIATDPDADRFAVVEKQSDVWHRFTGDQIGILLAEYRLQKCRMNGIRSSEMLFASTIVSSRMLKSMTQKEGCNYVDTLIGFKWIMDATMKLTSQNSWIPIFMYEEALGYSFLPSVRDKDGIAAAAVCVELLCELYTKGKTLKGHLGELYRRYGYFQTQNSYIFCYDPLEIKRIFDSIRNDGKYLSKFGEFGISSIQDITNGFDSAKPDKKLSIPSTPGSQMIYFGLTNGGAVTLRASGTEPKIKYYCELKADGGDSDETKHYLSLELNKLVEEIKKVLSIQ